MQVNIQPLDFSNLAALQLPATISGSLAFMDALSTSRDRLRNTDDGRLEIMISGNVFSSGQSVRVVFAAHEGDRFRQIRRQWFDTDYVKGSKVPPACTSATGDAPDASSVSPQSTTCASCPHSQRSAKGFIPCTQRKSFIVYAVHEDANGTHVMSDHPLVYDSSAHSLFAKYDEATRSAGVMELIPMLRAYGVSAIEAVVFELGYFQGNKSPVLKVVGQLDASIVTALIDKSTNANVKGLLTWAQPHALPAPASTSTSAPAPAPARGLPPIPVLGARNLAPVAVAPAPEPVAPVAAPAPSTPARRDVRKSALEAFKQAGML